MAYLTRKNIMAEAHTLTALHMINQRAKRTNTTQSYREVFTETLKLLYKTLIAAEQQVANEVQTSRVLNNFTADYFVADSKHNATDNAQFNTFAMCRQAQWTLRPASDSTYTALLSIEAAIQAGFTPNSKQTSLCYTIPNVNKHYLSLLL